MDQKYLNEKEMLTQYLKLGWKSYRDIPEKFKLDRDFILAALQKEPMMLKCASQEFKQDKEIVLEAVSRNGAALKHACLSFRSNEEVIFTAIKSNHEGFQWASPWHKDDEQFVLMALEHNPRVFEYVAKRLRNHTAVAHKALSAYFPNIKMAGKAIISDRELLMSCIKEYSRNNHHIASIVLPNCSEELSKDKEFLVEVLKDNHDFLYVHNDIKKIFAHETDKVKALKYLVEYESLNSKMPVNSTSTRKIKI